MRVFLITGASSGLGVQIAFSAGMQVTFSGGVATLRTEEHSDSFLARADKALYASKAQGRNRITSA